MAEYTPVKLALGKLRPEDQEHKARLENIQDTGSAAQQVKELGLDNLNALKEPETYMVEEKNQLPNVL